MNDINNSSKVNYRLEMTKHINLASYAGVFIIFINFIANVIFKSYFSEISHIGYMIFLMLNTCLSMLPFLMIYRIKCGKIKKLITVSKKERCSISELAGAVILGFGLCTTVNFLISFISVYVFNTETGTSVGQYINDIPTLLLAVPAIVIAPAVCEELLFRGCIIGSLKKYNVLMSVVISSLIFSVIHSGISGMIFAFLSGIIFGFLRIYTGYFSAAVAVHFMNNALALILAVVGSTISENAGDAIFYVTGIIGIILTIICVVLIVTKKIKLDRIFSHNDLPSAQPIENTVSSCGMLLVVVLCAIVADM